MAAYYKTEEQVQVCCNSTSWKHLNYAEIIALNAATIMQIWLIMQS